MPNYIKKVVGKVAGIAAAVTLGILSYTARPANAAEAPKKFEDPNLVRIVADSYARAPKGKELDENIMQLAFAACQDSKISPEDVTYILSTVPKRVSDPQKKKELALLGRRYAETKKKEVAAKAAYVLEINKANVKKGKDRTKGLLDAAKKYYAALKALEPAIDKLQYAEAMLEIAETGLQLAKQVPETLDVPDLEKCVAESKKALEQAKKEEHLLSRMLEYDAVIETALENVAKERTNAGKINWYSQVIDALKQAGAYLPYARFESQIKKLEAIIQGLEKAKPEEKPPVPKGGEQPAKPAETQPTAGTSDLDKRIKEAKAAVEAAKRRRDEAQKAVEEAKGKRKPGFADSGGAAGKKDDSDVSILGFLERLMGHKFDSTISLRSGVLTEDRDGDTQQGYVNFEQAVEALIRKESRFGENAAGNKVKNQKLSGMLDLQPLAFFVYDPKILSAGGSFDYDHEKEWEFLEDVTEDPGVKRVTTTENIRNFFETGFVSTWADLTAKKFKVRLTYFGEFTTNSSESHKLKITEDFINPAGSYPEEEDSETTDRDTTQGGTGLIAATLEPLDKSLRGYAGLLFKYTKRDINFAGLPNDEEHRGYFGVQGKVHDADQTFALMFGLLQELSKDEEKGKQALKTTSGQATAAINLGSIELEEGKKGIRGMLFGGAWFSLYKDIARIYGGNAGIALGSDIVDNIELSDLVEMSFMRDSIHTGLMPELNADMKAFLSRRIFDNITLKTIDGKEDEYGFALLFNGGAGKVQGMGGKTVTEMFAEGALILDLPKASFILSGYYADLALERLWGVSFKMYLDYFKKFNGLSIGFEFNQSRYLPTDELEREVAFALDVPLGSGGKDDTK